MLRNTMFLRLMAIPLVLANVYTADPNPVVQTAHGLVRGIKMPGIGNKPYDAFLGIPFAQPPVGQLRFANPQPPHYRSFIDATKAKAECIQKNSLAVNVFVSGEEDCLYLNLYRPLRTDDRSLLPVIVYIHGGAFFSGTASPDVLGPQYFMNTTQVIVVTIAYRLGALGFLSTGDRTIQGNFGLKDQTMALRWVQRNVQKFGGSPSNVTIMGVSAGAASVHMHMMSPLSAGLFHRGVSQSGNALGPYNIPTADPLALALRQAQVLGIQAKSKNDLLKSLRRVPARDLVDSIDALKFWSVDPLTLFRLVVETHGESGAFLTRSPEEISACGDYAAVPWMQSSVEHEGAIRAAPILVNATLVADLNSRLDELLPQLMELNGTENVSLDTINQSLQRRYLNGMKAITAENRQGFVNLYSERSFLYPLYNSVYDFVRTTDKPVHVVKFAFKGPYSYSALLTGTAEDFGVVHLDDTIYLFTSFFWPRFAPDSPAQKVSNALVEMYVEFAVNGKPLENVPIDACTSHAVTGGAMCQYYSYVNDDTDKAGFVVNVDNFFDASIVDFWDEILERKSR